MKVSYTWLQQYFEKSLPVPKDLGELINAHSFEVEALEIGSEDTLLDIKVMPDKAHYALCHRGIAREVSAILRMPRLERKVDEQKTGNVAAPEISVLNKELCRRYMARRIENITVGPSPQAVSKLLSFIGARPINNIVDATNFTMFDIGQPLHAFDADLVKGKIVVRKARDGEKIELLPETSVVDGRVISKERVLELKENDLVIADDEGLLALAGVKGGRRAEISQKTKNIIIEAANFNPVAVRRTAVRLNLRNESSRRFENEIIPELAAEAMKNVSALIAEMNPQAVFGPVADQFSGPTEKRLVSVRASFIIEKLGMSINEREIKEVVELIGCEIAGRDGEMLIVPPLDRLDISISEDFVDETARIMGYEKVSSAMPPKLDKPFPPDPSFIAAEKIKNTLVDLGYSEVMLYTLASAGSFVIEYPLASDKKALRESIIPKMRESLGMNAQNADLLGLDTIRIFEIGKVFPSDGEKTVLVLGVSVVKKKKGSNSENIIRDTLENLARNMALPESLLSSASIVKDSQSAYAEIDIDKYACKIASDTSLESLGFQALPTDQKYVQFSSYPFITRDIAVLVSESTSDAEVWSEILEGIKSVRAEGLLARHGIFDVFKKDGKNSFAYRMVFQAKDRTLTDKEVNSIMDAVYAKIGQKGWEIR